MNVMEITELTPDLVGKEISCKINGGTISNAEVYFKSPHYYILQNVHDGGHDRHVKASKTKFKYGWCVLNGSFVIGGLSDVFLLEPTYEIY